MTKQKILFLSVLAGLGFALMTGPAHAQQFFSPDGSSDTPQSSGATQEDNGLSVPEGNAYSPTGSAAAAAARGPKLGAHYIPSWTSDETVASIYYKLIGKAPDFSKWAQNTDQYKSATSFTQKDIVDNMVAQFKDDFNAVNLADDIVVRIRVRLSDYSDLNQGFIVEDGFSDDAYFRYKFGGSNFAVVPQHISENKWIPAPPNIAKDITQSSDAHKHTVNAALFIKPVYANVDGKPALLEDDSYYLISGTVSNIMFFDANWGHVMWEKNTQEYTDQQQQDLLNLKQ